jgi:predicted transglutaminase-like cysteine proteinase
MMGTIDADALLHRFHAPDAYRGVDPGEELAASGADFLVDFAERLSFQRVECDGPSRRLQGRGLRQSARDMIRRGSSPDNRPGWGFSAWLALFAVCLTLAAFRVEARDFSGLREQLAERLDPTRWPLLDDWLGMIAKAGTIDEEARLVRVNDFINDRIAFEDDASAGGQNDYGATPLETIGKQRGNCEDFVIIKYVSLRMAGVPGDKLRLVYAKARLDRLAEPAWIAHRVLAYYPAPDAEPFVLDNFNTMILPASRRPDLRPVFSFANDDGGFADVSGQDAAKINDDVGRLSRWEETWRRILADGYE